MTDLTDFLLSRIREDRDLLRHSLGHRPLTSGQRLGEFLAPGTVRRRQEADAVDEAMRLDDLRIALRCHRLTDQEIRALALPYADHSDYRQEWA